MPSVSMPHAASTGSASAVAWYLKWIWFWRTFREWVADLSSADDLPGLYSLVTTLGRARDAVVAGPANRTAGDSRKVSQSQFSAAVDNSCAVASIGVAQQLSRRRPVGPPPESVRRTSPIRTVVDSRSADTRPAAGGPCEPPTTPRSACDAPQPAGEAWAVMPGWSMLLQAAARRRPRAPRSTPAGSPCSAVRFATTFCSLAAALWPCLGRVCRAPVECRHDRCPFLIDDSGSCTAGQGIEL